MVSGPAALRQLLGAALLVCAFAAGAAPAGRDALLERHRRLTTALAQSDFGAPLQVSSAETGDLLSGEVDAVMSHPFATLRETLATAAQWCDVLILHVNVKTCSAVMKGKGVALSVGRKYEEEPRETEDIVLAFERHARAADYLAVRIHAAEGPFGTRDYDLSFEAVPLDAGRSYVHLAYSYQQGGAARLAMRSYLATVGRNRVGFTVTGSRPDGGVELVGGLRGAIERNAMRYYLAVDTCLETAGLAVAVRQERRLELWFDATTRYSRQLVDVTREEYLGMKRRAMRKASTG